MSEKVLLLDAIRGQITPRPPVWLMRQAGRYMEEYVELKEKHGFLKLCRTPDLAVEVSLQPIRAFDLDAAIIFSDILIPLSDLGINFDFTPAPKITNPLKKPEDIERLSAGNLRKSVGFVFEAIAKLKNELAFYSKEQYRKAVIGFSGAPWTLACYAIDQGPYKQFQGTQVFAYRHHDAFDHLMNLLTELCSKYLIEQFRAGADAVQLFDSWAGILSAEDYSQLALPYTKRIISILKEEGCPTILYVGNSAHLHNKMEDSGANCLSLDWRADLKSVYLHSNKAIQGNLDPSSLFQSHSQIIAATKEMLSKIGDHTRYIANLGHGVLPGTPREAVQTFVKTIKEGWVND